MLTITAPSIEDVKALTEIQRAAAYLSGDTETMDRLWWIKHWQWRDSPGHHRLCLIHEAICQLAWEHEIPALSVEQEQIFEAVQVLNSFAKCVPFTNGQKQIYWLKRAAIRWACDLGLGNIRAVVTRKSCRRCDGECRIGDDWFYGEEAAYSKCRRCSGRGYVDLYFHEIDIAGRFTFHQPHDHTTPFAGHQINRLVARPDPLLELNREGRKLDWEQASDLVRFLKRRFWADQPGYVKEIYTYMNQEPVWSRW